MQLLTAGTNYVYHMDAIRLLGMLPNNSIDLIPTDPPYGIQYSAGSRKDFSGRPRKMEGKFGSDKFDPSWLPLAVRKLKEGGALYICSRWDVLHLWKQAIESAGLQVKQRIVWDKGHWGAGDLAYFGSQTEDILFAVKGDHKLLWERRAGNVWRVGGQGNIWNENRAKYHVTQKPIVLMQRMIMLSSKSDDLIVDPFCGSGTTLVAAHRMGRRYIGCDVVEHYVEITKRRLEQSHTTPMFAA